MTQRSWEARAHAAQAGRECLHFEASYKDLQLRRHLSQGAGGYLRFACAAGGHLRGMSYVGDVFGNFAGAHGCICDIASDLVRGGGLFFHRRGDRGRDVIDLVDNLADLCDGLDGGAGVGLDGFDFLANVLGSACRFLGEFLDFVGNDREAFTCLPGARGLDGCVQREQIGLLRNGGDTLMTLPISCEETPSLEMVSLVE